MQVSKRYANFVRVGSDGNVEYFSKTGNEIFKTEENLNQSSPVLNINKVSIQEGEIGSTIGSGTKYGAFITSSGNGAFYEEDGAPIVDIENYSGTGLKFRLDMRSGNASGLTGMPSSNGQFYCLNKILAGTTMFVFDYLGNFGIARILKSYNGAPTAMAGLAAISGSPDLRIGVTAADTSAITIFSSPAGSNDLYFRSKKFSILRVRASSLKAHATNIAIRNDVTGSIVRLIILTHSLLHLHSLLNLSAKLFVP